MAKLHSPLFSFGATGRLGRALTIARRRAASVWLLRGRPADPRSPAQLSWRNMYQMGVNLWHALSESEILEWERAGTRRHMTGFAWFMSQCLRPNPGLYLPLAGGTMTGEIDMNDFAIGGLIDPTTDDKAARKKYVDDHIAPLLAPAGCRARRSADQNVNSGALTTINFDTTDYDTDSMWAGAGQPARVRIHTAGIYLIIGQIHWSARNAGYRGLLLWHSAATYIGQARLGWSVGDYLSRGHVETTWDCAAGTYLELRVIQNSAAQLQAKADGYQASVLSANRIG